MITIKNMWQEWKLRVMAWKPITLTHIVAFTKEVWVNLPTKNLHKAWGNYLESSRSSQKNKSYTFDYLTRKLDSVNLEYE